MFKAHINSRVVVGEISILISIGLQRPTGSLNLETDLQSVGRTKSVSNLHPSTDPSSIGE